MEETALKTTPEKKSTARRALTALLAFAAVMLALTYGSRAVSEALKARVSTGYAGAGTLDESVEGTGTWTVGETQLYTAYFARRITAVYVQPGQRVEAGDPLFAYDVSTVTGGKEISDSKLRAARKAVEKAEKAAEHAENPLYAQNVLESAKQALTFAEFTYEQYYAIQNGGVVRATFSGTLVKCDLQVGKAATAGVSGLELAPGGVAFTLQLSAKEAERVAVGDAVTLLTDGQEEPQTLTVERLLAPDAEGSVAAICAGDGGRARVAGAKQAFIVKKQSARYQLCVPLSALRQSGPEQYYVLLLTEKETILGTQYAVKAQTVTLLARDSRRAAIEGSVSERDRLITASSKELRDGDYVRMQDA